MTQGPVVPTIEFGASGAKTWDALVIGAGPAGTMASLTLAQTGARVLLVDRADFPRRKVCGCCLSGHAQRILADAGMPRLLDSLGARRIDRVDIVAAGRRLESALAPTRVVSREAFDAALVRAAICEGVHFLARTCARFAAPNRVALSHGGTSIDVHARTIVLAGGLHAAACSACRLRSFARASYVGLGATGDPGAAPALQRCLTMALGRSGYVGFVHLEGGNLHAAAALAPSLLKAADSPAHAVALVLAEAGLAEVDPHRLAWHGTPPLTHRRRRVQQGRVFAIGDAARFVEPVTGEGMTWAMDSGRAVAPHVLARLKSASAPETWPHAHRRLLRSRHLRCAIVSHAMRRPGSVAAFMRAMRLRPGLSERVIRTLIGASADAHPEPAE